MDQTPEETAETVSIPSDTWQLIVRAAQWISHPQTHTMVMNAPRHIMDAMDADLKNFAHHVTNTKAARPDQ